MLAKNLLSYFLRNGNLQANFSTALTAKAALSKTNMKNIFLSPPPKAQATLGEEGDWVKDFKP